MVTEEALVTSIAKELAPHRFVTRAVDLPLEGAEVVQAWVRKTWNTNRAVVVLRLPAGAHPGVLSQRLKIPLGKCVGYFPLFYGVGLQLVWLTHEAQAPHAPPLNDFVDAIDNQRSIVQSLFVVDRAARRVSSARTWGQVVTGPFQDAIARGIEGVLSQPPAP